MGGDGEESIWNNRLKKTIDTEVKPVMSVCVSVCLYLCVCICVLLCACMCVSVCVCLFVCLRVYAHISCVFVHVVVCVYLRVCVCRSILLRMSLFQLNCYSSSSSLRYQLWSYSLAESSIPLDAMMHFTLFQILQFPKLFRLHGNFFQFDHFPTKFSV